MSGHNFGRNPLISLVRTTLQKNAIRVTGPLTGWVHLLNPLPHKIFVWDRKGIYQDCLYPNPEYGHFLSGKALKGKTISEVLSREQAKVVLRGIQQALAGRHSVQAKLKWRTASGTFQTHIRFIPILNVVMGIVRDQPVTHGQRPENIVQMVNGREPLSRLEETHLTSREQQILVEVQRGKTNREIAQALHITPRTVKFHLSNMFCKLHISSRRALNDVASEADYEHDQPPGSGQMVPQHKNPVVVPRLLKKPYSKE